MSDESTCETLVTRDFINYQHEEEEPPPASVFGVERSDSTKPVAGFFFPLSLMSQTSLYAVDGFPSSRCKHENEPATRSPAREEEAGRVTVCLFAVVSMLPSLSPLESGKTTFTFNANSRDEAKVNPSPKNFT
jgi:hypothetical protein